MAVILGAKPPIPTTQFVIGESKTFTVPITGKMKVVLTGGGGQGAFLANKNQTPTSNVGDGTGGGAGGYSEKTFFVTAGETFTVTIGAGGATALAMNDVNSSRVGNDGGNSSFVTASAATTVNMAANGGGGGQYSAATTSAVTTAGGTGGTASGGDVNYTGGAGGAITRVANNNTGAMVTGGGAVSIYGNVFRGGNITLNTANASSNMIGASGGAGVGGTGGDCSFTGTSAAGSVSNGGSATKTGAAHDSIDLVTGSFLAGITGGGPTSDPTISVIDAQGLSYGANYDYNNSNYVTDAVFGAGSSGGANWNNNNSNGYYSRVGTAGGFGGGGGCCFVSGIDYSGSGDVFAGAGGVGGGGSGAYSGPFSTMTSASGRKWAAGGDGVCIIMFV